MYIDHWFLTLDVPELREKPIIHYFSKINAAFSCSDILPLSHIDYILGL